MRLLLDTHVFIWLLHEPERLGEQLEHLRDPATERLVSAVVPWEITIKHQLGKITLPQPPQTYVPQRMREMRAVSVPIDQSHALEVAGLPPLHRDPFDRMLVAQSRLLGVPILTANPAIAAYPVEAILI